MKDNKAYSVQFCVDKMPEPFQEHSFRYISEYLSVLVKLGIVLQ